MTYPFPLGIEAIPPAPIFAHIHHAPRASWLERNEGTLISIACIAACVVGYWFRCM